MINVPDSHRDLLEDSTLSFAFLATTDGTHILIDTAEGRVKDRNMRARVALCIPDPKDSYRFIQIRGRVVERTYEGADALIDVLHRKYHNGEPWQPRPGQVRVIYKILPERLDAEIN